ncbi:hypothetical protein ACFV1F_31055 [Streptomyces sp. NPDC059590]|uniref:hypothetical protein n=1 Tax=Streptomyces sp. NPDC059590 TaxID=3346877 RepID=UPI0036C87683
MTTTAVISGDVPLPYGEHALLTPAMTEGYDAVPPMERNRLLGYLEAVVAARQVPVHAAVAFNAAYFGYDLNGDGYGGSPLRLDDFPAVTLGECAPALPVGAMVCIATGSDPLYAEIVYKEGAHPAISSLGDVPAWVSGAPAGAEGPGRPGPDGTIRRRELLVPDPHAFGPGLSLTPTQLNRLRAHRRWINEDGHVIVDVGYPSHEAARRADLPAYADYLLTTARAQLLSPFVPVSLTELVGSGHETVLRSGLERLLETIRQILESSDLLRMWGPYAMTREALAAGWRDTGPLGGDDLKTLAAALEHAATPSRRRYGLTAPTTVYTAVGPRLRTFPGAEDLVRGVGYAAAVYRANVTLADVVRRDSDQGLFANGTRLSLDDAFEGGGVWRSRHPGDEADAGDPLTPTGSGWQSTTEKTPRGADHRQANAAEDAATEEDSAQQNAQPVDEPLQDDAALAPGQLLRIGDSEISWRLPLRLAHLIDGYLPLRPLIADELRLACERQATVRLELAHIGGEVDESEAVQDTIAELGDGAGRLLGVAWPIDFFPGLELHLQWPRGGRVIRASTIPLDNPVQVDDRTIEHRYDPLVLTREDAPGSDRTRDSAADLTPRQLVMRTVRRCGLLTSDGHALLDHAALPTAVYGLQPAAAKASALENAVQELLAERHLEPATGSRGDDGRPHFPARSGETEIRLIGYTPDVVPLPRSPDASSTSTGPVPQPSTLTLQYVPGHLRRLLPGSSAGDAQRAAFREHCRRLGKADGWELPDGYTFVTQHTRGH